ncbi:MULTISPECIES: heptaprenyl diphosphate synthase component 1 [Bacillus]|uniref:Heptaprenyl diphosphate synthase component I n=1 Tax=Bacillus cereus (strain ATCC 14579 / DSM 31 / CCUG 7414 / JCM 2152 / NBRC 15305 / NCIMB 9373 / NCTC 2599 / NRRL B-3711) TaxID=226900 RepID=Q81FQ7_BACCR|nr:heptaprenyl diphosphate synthase component 1 [Bacillus cereus]AAP08492.1 Heptaprenyl diphosphate synthase component I [Bacillus cereus ATCC 14579]KZD73492.1 Heptaprenyl diphosphate synthase component I [Bacillus cereus]MCC3286255.1 heptaprenyl diphosphate synthase component 1 [Bacillus cereus]MEB9613719.1 heptaprenyl diphosphate synthase component 1 [Bacillus cereus]MEB9997551.1 heptaprenyl diphosphate synthase component 1 [Bacillus cereus]
MCDIYRGYAGIKEKLMEKLRHPYFINYIEEPFIDEEKIALLYGALKSANLHIEQIEHYVVTIMLVQIALDTHERVSNKAGEEEIGFHKCRQLTVLAGDYYSGLYYYLLSMNRDIVLIRALAEGIKEINEHKIMLYQKAHETTDDIMKSIVTIESALLQKTCDHFQLSHWKPFITYVLGGNRLQKEIQLYADKQHSPVFQAMQDALGDKAEVVINGWMKELRKKEKQFLENHTDINEINSVLRNK